MPNPGTVRAPQTYELAGITARYVRVTATRLAPRKDDYIFALAEMELFDGAGLNRAAGRPVTALDSIEAPVRWQRINSWMVSYAGPGRQRRKLPSWEPRRRELLETRVPEEITAEQARVGDGLAALAEELETTSAGAGLRRWRASWFRQLSRHRS
ncbi:MAG: hypothetical protein R3B90_14215 [Planctomycetaceae bacterium]